MASKAASQVKMGFWIAAGFWVFGVVAMILVGLAARSVISGNP
jgi:hypothetical protein